MDSEFRVDLDFRVSGLGSDPTPGSSSSFATFTAWCLDFTSTGTLDYNRKTKKTITIIISLIIIVQIIIITI